MCKPLPRPEYKSLERILPDDPWFEVYKVAPGVFAIYEPHQAKSYFLPDRWHQAGGAFRYRNGHQRHSQSHNEIDLASGGGSQFAHHDDHVGGNWQFAFVYAWTPIHAEECQRLA